jgi:hypothetical protein
VGQKTDEWKESRQTGRMDHLLYERTDAQDNREIETHRDRATGSNYQTDS